MAKIRIERREYPEGMRPPSLRFTCQVRLSTIPGIPATALIDTGAPLTLLPRQAWERSESDIEFLATPSGWRAIRGLGGASVPCRLAQIHIMLADSTPSHSTWLRVPAQLAETNAVPLILGVAGFLDTYEVALNRDGESYVVVPGRLRPAPSAPD
jgi:hypothetical protein